MHLRLPVLAAISIAAAGMLMSGCGPLSDEQAASVRTVQAILPLDQDGDDIRDWRTAMELAVEELGAERDGLEVRGAYANDSKPNGEESATRAAAAAKVAVKEPSTLAVIGPASSSSTAMVAPILNRAGMLEVLMSATSVSLTSRLDGGVGPPRDTAPTGQRNLVRIVPTDRVQALALLEYLREEGVDRIEIIDDGLRFGTGLAGDIVKYAPGSGVTVVRAGTSDRENVSRLASSVAAGNQGKRGRWALLMAVNDQEMAVRAAHSAAMVDSSVVIAGPDSLTFRGFLTGIGSLAESAYVTTFELPLEYYGPQGDRVSRILRNRLGHRPAAGTLFSYEAMALAIDSIREAHRRGQIDGKPIAAQRRAVTKVALATENRGSVIGTYSIGLTGDTTNSLFGAYRVKDGLLAKGRAVDTEGRE